MAFFKRRCGLITTDAIMEKKRAPHVTLSISLSFVAKSSVVQSCLFRMKKKFIQLFPEKPNTDLHFHSKVFVQLSMCTNVEFRIEFQEKQDLNNAQQ